VKSGTEKLLIKAFWQREDLTKRQENSMAITVKIRD